MILMLPTFYEQAIYDRASFNQTYITDKINTLFASSGIAINLRVLAAEGAKNDLYS